MAFRTRSVDVFLSSPNPDPSPSPLPSYGPDPSPSRSINSSGFGSRLPTKVLGVNLLCEWFPGLRDETAGSKVAHTTRRSLQIIPSQERGLVPVITKLCNPRSGYVCRVAGWHSTVRADERRQPPTHRFTPPLPFAAMLNSGQLAATERGGCPGVPCTLR